MPDAGERERIVHTVLLDVASSESEVCDLMPVLYFTIGERVVGLNAVAAEELGERARRTPGAEDIARIIESTGVLRSVRLSFSEQQRLRDILDLWALEVGIDRLWPGARELLAAITDSSAPQ